MKKWWTELVAAFRARSKYFQYKAYIGAAYVFILITTVVIVVPRTPSNRLKAYVLAARGDFVVGAYIMVRNDSSKEWEKVKLTLNGTHVFNVDRLKPGDKVTAPLPKFQGAGKIEAEQVRELKIDCSRGHEVYAVTFGAKNR